MVTLATEAARDPAIIKDLILAGADCFRINSAHDAMDDWQQMVDHVRHASIEARRPCSINMELAGPKPRTREVHLEDPKRRLYLGDRILLMRSLGKTDGSTPCCADISLPEVLNQVRLGETVWFDEGRFGGRVVELNDRGIVLQLEHALPKGGKLRPGKGLNFPDSCLNVGPLTADDSKNLDFVAAHADMVGCSFVREVSDIDTIQGELDKNLNGRPAPALMVKIETAQAVRNLPDLIVRAAGRQPLAVMIARGDLAIEIGYERLAEIQEEILWLCEAAHVPVIWATQVLDRLVRKGTPTRAEITDAAMGERAECVMLNKGPYIRQAVAMLDDVLTRMEEHQSKKTAQLRALKCWQYLSPNP
jgi:pyruvate kinase